MKTFELGCILGAGTASVVLIIIGAILEPKSKQASYEDIYKGRVACIDTPNNKIYCFEVEDKKSN